MPDEKQLVEILVEQGMITDEQLQRALEIQRGGETDSQREETAESSRINALRIPVRGYSQLEAYVTRFTGVARYVSGPDEGCFVSPAQLKEESEIRIYFELDPVHRISFPTLRGVPFVDRIVKYPGLAVPSGMVEIATSGIEVDATPITPDTIRVRDVGGQSNLTRLTDGLPYQSQMDLGPNSFFSFNLTPLERKKLVGLLSEMDELTSQDAEWSRALKSYVDRYQTGEFSQEAYTLVGHFRLDQGTVLGAGTQVEQPFTVTEIDNPLRELLCDWEHAASLDEDSFESEGRRRLQEAGERKEFDLEVEGKTYRVTVNPQDDLIYGGIGIISVPYCSLLIQSEEGNIVSPPSLEDWKLSEVKLVFCDTPYHLQGILAESRRGGTFMSIGGGAGDASAKDVFAILNNNSALVSALSKELPPEYKAKMSIFSPRVLYSGGSSFQSWKSIDEVLPTKGH